MSEPRDPTPRREPVAGGEPTRRYQAPQSWARAERDPQNWPRGSSGSIRDAVSSRRDAQRAEEPRREPRPASRTAVARAERRRLDQPKEPGRIRLPRFDPEAFGRWSEAIARGLGTAQFIVYMTVFLVVWFAWNTLGPKQLRFDPYTFTFMTLLLSLQASYAAPLILLAQNRQADRDRLSLEEDRRRATMQKADTEYLAREIASLRIALGEVATRDFVRSELNRLLEDLGEAADRRTKLERKEQRRQARRQADPTGDEDSEPESAPAVKKERRAPQGARRATPTS
jgi:uncharacterized membrane protein